MAKKRQDQDPELWERRADLGEDAHSYKYFCAYRDMGRPLPSSKRSLRDCAKQLGVTRAKLEVRSRKYEWVARVQAYDDYMERRTREENEAAIIKMRQNHAKIATQLLVKAAKRLLSLPEDSISAKDTVAMIETGVKVERLSRGETTESRQVRGELKTEIHGEVNQHIDGGIAVSSVPIDLSKLTEDELDDLERLCKKIQPADTDE